MKILLTGLPKTGKTTLIQKLITELDDPYWVISREILDNDNERLGFEAHNVLGNSVVFAHKHEIQSPDHVGEYAVSVPAIDSIFYEPLIVTNEIKENEYLVIDEIGRMQIISPVFLGMIRQLLAQDKNILATIQYGDEWTKEFTENNNVITLTLTAENRDEIEACLNAAIHATTQVNDLKPSQKMVIYKLAVDYLEQGQYLQFKKLFNNAIPYVSEEKVQLQGNQTFKVQGRHGEYFTTMIHDVWKCDCDLNNGINQYKGHGGECSHIQACKLSTA